ncbi:hypothetical protein BH20VER1_BH20VER1_28880 [soil metagenome]
MFITAGKTFPTAGTDGSDRGSASPRAEGVKANASSVTTAVIRTLLI